MFIDFLSLLLINMMAGFVLLAWYVYAGLDDPDQPRWAPGFIVTGLIAFLFGGYITLTWPLPGPYNSAFGELSVLFGALFLAAGIVMARGGNLLTLGLYAFFAGWVAILLSVRVLMLKLTSTPPVTALGFFASGFAGVLALPGLLWFKQNRLLRTLVAIMLLLTAALWALVGYGAYWMHMTAFAHWMPASMRGLPPMGK